jgi:hypothetical protein
MPVVEIYLRLDSDPKNLIYEQTLDMEKGLLGLIFNKSQNRFQDPACVIGGFLLTADENTIVYNLNITSNILLIIPLKLR